MAGSEQPSGVFARVAPAVKRRLQRLADENRRSLGAEVAVAIDAHLRAAEKARQK